MSPSLSFQNYLAEHGVYGEHCDAGWAEPHEGRSHMFLLPLIPGCGVWGWGRGRGLSCSFGRDRAIHGPLLPSSGLVLYILRFCKLQN